MRWSGDAKDGAGCWPGRSCARALTREPWPQGSRRSARFSPPVEITEATKADIAIDVWEDKIAKLSIEYGENVSNKVKAAVLYSMLPKDLQERVLGKCVVS